MKLLLDLGELVHEWGPVDPLLRQFDLEMEDLFITGVSTWQEVPKAYIRTESDRYQHQLYLDLLCDYVLFSNIDPKDYSARDLNDVVRVIRAIALRIYVMLEEFSEQMDLSEMQRDSINNVRWTEPFLSFTVVPNKR